MSDRDTIIESTGYWLTRIARSMERDFEARLAPLGITRAAFAMLSAILHEKKTTPAELAAFLGVDGAAITRHLDRVEKLDLIERKPSTSDRRSIDIKLTTEGRKIVRRGHAASKSTNKKFTADLGDSEVESLHATIQTMLSRSDAAVADL